MHIHILGICGTFMGGLAVLAKEAGHKVTGCDANVYPPMSTQLRAQGIELIEGYGQYQLSLQPDLYVVGNVVSRGNSLMETIMNRGLPYMSGPQWMGEYILHDKWVLAVAGTHGKTTTASMLAWILEQAGYNPGFLIGGVPLNFGVSARLFLLLVESLPMAAKSLSSVWWHVVAGVRSNGSMMPARKAGAWSSMMTVASMFTSMGNDKER